MKISKKELSKLNRLIDKEIKSCPESRRKAIIETYQSLLNSIEAAGAGGATESFSIDTLNFSRLTTLSLIFILGSNNIRFVYDQWTNTFSITEGIQKNEIKNTDI
jgi:hypothetical protein